MGDNGHALTSGDHADNAGRLREGKGSCWKGKLVLPLQRVNLQDLYAIADISICNKNTTGKKSIAYR